MDTVYNFGKILKDLRIKRGLTQTQLGTMISVADSTISKYESNITPPDGLTVKKLSDVLNVSCDYMLGNEPAASISLFRLTDKQEDVIKELVGLFQDHNNRISSQPTDDELKIVGKVMSCFIDK